MTSQGMGSRKGKGLWKDSACSSFLEQGRERERSKVGEGKEERGEPGEQVEGKGGKLQSRWRSLMTSQAWAAERARTCGRIAHEQGRERERGQRWRERRRGGESR